MQNINLHYQMLQQPQDQTTTSTDDARVMVKSLNL